jgi:ABC-type oligopeptide transport system substrate-binding subunit
VRTPRRAAVVLSAFALTGALAACGGDDDVNDTNGTDPGVTDPLAPEGGVEGEGEVEPAP